jgi:membrane protease YdiL (CAAX protease family)
VALGSLALAPAVAEETLYRGLVQPRLVRHWGRWPGIAAASLAFAANHVDPVQAGVAFTVGLFLGWSADRLGGIHATIVAHAINKAVFLLAMANADPSPSPIGRLGRLGAGIALSLLGVFALSAQGARSPGESAARRPPPP